MKIRYAVPCAICAVKGETNYLYLDTDEDGVNCPKGHMFESLDAAEHYDPLAAPPEPVQQAAAKEPVETPVAAPAPPVAATIAGNGDSAASALEPTPQIDPEPVPVTVVTPARVEAEVQEAPKPVPVPRKFIPPPPKKLPGGVLLMTIKIPDQHVSGLCAEAEVQKQTPQQFFQERVEFGLVNGWFF